eukprot:366574-Chlamydomonas_euryale.AAC.13
MLSATCAVFCVNRVGDMALYQASYNVDQLVWEGSDGTNPVWQGWTVFWSGLMGVGQHGNNTVHRRGMDLVPDHQEKICECNGKGVAAVVSCVCLGLAAVRGGRSSVAREPKAVFPRIVEPATRAKSIPSPLS